MLFNGSGISIFRRSDQNRSRVCFKSLCPRQGRNQRRGALSLRSEEHTSDSSHGYISYAGFCLKKKTYHVRPHRQKAPDHRELSQSAPTSQSATARDAAQKNTDLSGSQTEWSPGNHSRNYSASRY